MVYGFEARLTRGGAGVLLLALILLMAGCASGGGDDTAEPGEGDGDTDGNGGFTSDNGDGDAAAGDGDDGTNTDIGDQDFSSDDPDAMQQDGSSGGVGGGGSDVDPQSECVDREEALAMLEGLEVSLPSCEDDVCTQAHCLAANVIPEDQRDFLADCTDTEKCVPDTLIATLGMAPLPICESIDGAEGRCVSTCVPLVRVQADVLPRDICADDELCAPCFDPITQEATGACGLVCDETQGPVDEPYFFPECCGDIGVCVPSEFVPAGQVDLLGKDSCQGDGVLCAPRELASDRSASPPSCTSLEGAEGRCLAACIPDVARQADQLPKDSCDDGYLCAPCYDPISGADTGACGIGDDPGPTGDPVLFDTCCNNGNADVGVCVPSAIVPSDQVGLLGPDTCVDSGYLCAPADVAAGSYTPDTCVSLGSGEGRCLPACLPDIAAQAAVLDQAACGVGELCAPCWDPI
ncbi:MAG: hypothetical protein OXT09_22065, partial [Myxococcales bacterium]|nr:hypothetical protein [Myxococcales bacterium]